MFEGSEKVFVGLVWRVKGKNGSDEAGEVNRGRAAVYGQTGYTGHSSTA